MVSMKYNLSKIMKRAWNLFKTTGHAFAQCLHMAWNEAKGMVIMSKKEMFELLENMQNGLSKKDMEYTNIRISEMKERFEKVNENQWNETLEKHGRNRIIGSAIDYVFDATQLSCIVRTKYKKEIEASTAVRMKYL